ncbi:MAG: histidine triad nucleotide-binding protein [Micrococcales bacterium]|nr:histidine triad nucleotide-binding protein [Micrococcales bacterium]
MSTDCLFCRIIAGEIPADVVAETEHSLAFRDISPQAPTHVLVIPRRHEPNAAALAAVAPEEMADAWALVARVAEIDGLEGYRTVANTGAAAQQTVFHMHLHVIGGRELTWPPG